MSITLQDISKRVVTVTVKNESTDFALDIRVQLPSLADWNNSLLDVEFPDPSDYKKRKLNDKGMNEDYIDYSDPEYLQKRDAALNLLAMRRVCQAMIGGGELEDLAKLPLTEATERLMEKADRSILMAVNQAMINVMGGTKGGVEAKKAAFRHDSVSENGHEDMRQEELEA